MKYPFLKGLGCRKRFGLAAHRSGHHSRATVELENHHLAVSHPLALAIGRGGWPIDLLASGTTCNVPGLDAGITSTYGLPTRNPTELLSATPRARQGITLSCVKSISRPVLFPHKGVYMRVLLPR